MNRGRKRVVNFITGNRRKIMNPVVNQRIALKAIIINSAGKVLILREANTYQEGTNAGKYDVPGGRLEPGEVWSDGLIREVSEETGLKVELVKPIRVDECRPVINGVHNEIVGILMLRTMSRSESL